MKKRLDLDEATILLLLIFTFMAIFIKGVGPTSLIIALLSVATFLFGIFGAFVMQNRHNRLDALRETLRKDDALYLNIYKMSAIFGKKVQKQVQKLIDNYIIKTIDYYITDYNKAGKDFLKLYDYLKDLEVKTPKEEMAFSVISNRINEANINRRHIDLLARNNMLKFKLFTLIGLLLIILFSVFYINDNSIPSIIISVLLSTSSVTLLLVLRDMDSLFWKEQKWIWDPLEQLFNELDLIPYYPKDVITLKRIKLKKGTKIRAAYYPRPYPDFRGKKVKIEIVK